MSIMAGKGTGKDSLLSWLLLWFLCVIPRGKVIATGPSFDQIKDVLWAEVSKWVNRMDSAGQQMFAFYDNIVIKNDLIHIKGAVDAKQKGYASFAKIRTAPVAADKETQAKTLSGWHEDFMLVLLDEASAIPPPVFQALDTTLTRPVNIAVMAFNPSLTKGFAIETHTGKHVNGWIQLHWPSTESSLVTREQINRIKETYGIDSIEYRVDVLGLPPLDDNRSLILASWVENAKNKEVEENPNDPVIFGVDVARFGSDKSTILVRRGNIELDLLEFTKIDTVSLSEWITMVSAEYNPVAIYIDTCGVGGGVYDILRRSGLPVRSVNASDAASDPKKFSNLRSELFWELRRRFEAGLIKIKDDRKTINELTGLRLKDGEAKGRIAVENKLDMKRRGMPSPNRADAWMLTMRANEEALKFVEKKKKDAYDEDDDYKFKPVSWLGA
jgi:hypothetical protein